MVDFVTQTLDSLDHSQVAIVQAPPGAGKTTRIPAALIDVFPKGRVIVSEPRRIAAKLAARYVAELRGGKPGAEVGYRVRFDQQIGPQTRLEFITMGLLPHLFSKNPTLEGIAALVFDEFHERHLSCDLGLALAQRVLAQNTDIKIIIMSATLQTQALRRQFPKAALIEASARQYPIETVYLSPQNKERLENHVHRAVKLAHTLHHADILVFLPGLAEIDRCKNTLKNLPIEVHRLHGALNHKEQDSALSKSQKRKVILTTNIAETSVTVPGVGVVIDSGLVREAVFNPTRGLPSLVTKTISQDSAIQRAGRAGRLGPGLCIRMCSEHNYRTWPKVMRPQILRSDLAQTLLDIYALKIDSPQKLPWLDPPEERAWESSATLLSRLGFLNNDRLSSLGQRAARIPSHPRLARILLAAHAEGYPKAGARLVAMLDDRPPRLPRDHDESSNSDWVLLFYRLGLDGAQKPSRLELQDIGYSEYRIKSLKQRAQQLGQSLESNVPEPTLSLDDALRKSILAGFIDRVGRRRDRQKTSLKLAFGGAVSIGPRSSVQGGLWLVATEFDDRNRGQRKDASLQSATVVEADWVLEYGDSEIETQSDVIFDPERERVYCVDRMAYGSCALFEERHSSANDSSRRCLLDAAQKAGIERFVEPKILRSWRARIELLKTHHYEVPSFDDNAIFSFLEDCLGESTSFDDIQNLDIFNAMIHSLEANFAQRLERLAPKKLKLRGGRWVEIDYLNDGGPACGTYLQEFFGTQEVPKLLDGRIPLTLKLWAPNRRPIQVTQDLQSFWDKHYPKLRNQLMRRYPRHSWPENPVDASPPTRSGGRKERKNN